jgi:hypothetical protein
MDIFQSFHGFKFYYNLTQNDQVQPVEPNLLLLEENVNLFLIFKGNLPMAKGYAPSD